ncbi:MauE/DoxX family redox-associated membrane protein [Silvibacterium acidisoli]|uniref:MauE/DoxX family redox-associated membrane protein n=1 Tax=Acidobacteriaceae bacterium ZG23-2 TaxID=2883246 RepID=UPI00406CA970
MATEETIRDRRWAYLLVRIILGINIGVHGASRIYMGAGKFARGLVKMFASTPLPSQMVYSYAFALPFAEALVGLLILLGVFSRITFIAGLLLMASLTFGSTLRQDWDSAGLQLIYVMVYAGLLAFREYNRSPVGKQLI